MGVGSCSAPSAHPRMIQQHIKQARARRRESEIQEVDNTSPVKTVLGSFSQITPKEPLLQTPHGRLGQSQNGTIAPTRIEDVPFRRQDRRTLNARYRRIMDRKPILCIIGSGLLLFFWGVGLLVLYNIFKEEYNYIRPFVVIGPVLIGGGFMTIGFSVEVCVRLYHAKKRMQDPELDNLINPHEVKHWMDPALIPYGWGLFSEGEEVIVVERGTEDEKVEEMEPPVAVTGILVKPGHLVHLVEGGEQARKLSSENGQNM